MGLTSEEIERIVSAVPGGAANVQDIYPLAPLQEGILFHHLLATVGDPYLLRVVYRVDTRTRLDAYLAALQSVIDRHDILRTAMLWEGLPEPAQVVLRKATLIVEEVDLDPASRDVVEQLAARFDPRTYRIDVRQAPLLRVAVARDAANERWAMVLLFHHLALDHVALEIVNQELEAHLLGQSAQLPAPMPFRNVVAQARFGVSREEHEAFFREMLSDVDEPTAPFGLIDVRGDGSGIAQARRAVAPALSKRLRARARALGVSAASICHLAWARVLGAISGREDVVFGTVLFGRMQGGEGTDRVLGLLINTLPIRIRTGGQSVRESVLQTHARLAQLLHHEHASLALAQRCSAVVAPTPLFSALLNYRNSSPGETDPGKKHSAWDGIEALHGEERTNFPLTLAVDDLGEGFVLTAQVDAMHDPERICEFMHATLERLVDALDREPTMEVRRVEVLPAAERRQVLVDWNATERAYPADRCIHELFEEQVARAPDAIAVVHEGEQLSYGQMNAQANRLAQYLQTLGVKPDSRVAVCVERSLEMVVGLLAVLKAGGAYVPLDPSYPIERLSYMLEDSAPVVVLTHGRVPSAVHDVLRASGVAMVDLVADAQRWDTASASNPERSGLTPKHLAYVIYTSGSTGQPKGVMNEHGALVNRLSWMQERYGLGADDAVLQKTPFSFDVSVWEFFWPLLNGAKLVMARADGHKDPYYLASIIREQRITTMHFVPSMLHVFLEHDEAATGTDLKRVLCSGEALPGALARRFRERLPHVELHNLYGPTEAAIDVTAWACDPEVLPDNIPIGRPISNIRVYILDPHGEPVAIGVAGELYIGGVGVARGYLNRPELTGERFVPSPFVDGDRLYKTGDLVRYLPDGTIEYLGRNDFQVKIRGFRIELGEIEARLAQYSGIREAVVLAREDAPGEKRLVAYYTTAPDAGDVSVDALREHLLATLPEYMVPSAYVALDALPLTPNGKLDRKGLPAPDGTAYAVRAYEAPSGEAECAIAEIWCEVLKLDRVGRHDNFFELGGHSLLAVRVLSRARQALEIEVNLSELFAHPELCEFAAVVRRTTKSALSIIAMTSRDGPLPLSFAQQRLWFLSQLEGVSQAYHIPIALRLQGELDRDALRWSLDRIIARHETLRTTFRVVDGDPVQHVDPTDVGFRLLEQDLRSSEDAIGELERLAEQEAICPFDLTAGPLIRGRLVATGANEHALIITMHHIVSDGWSLGVLIRELSTLYRAYRETGTDPLSPLTIQYADYAAWQRNWLSGDVLREQVDYWQRTLKDVPALLEVPTDRPRPAKQDHNGSRIGLQLDTELTAGLKALSRRHGATLFMTLLAAWGALLARLSGQDDVVVGTPLANRTRAEVEELIGFFVNTLALRLDFSGSPTVQQVLERVKAQTLQAQQHQELPFEQVVEIANPPRSLAHAPLFQAMFAWQNNEIGELTLPGLQLSAMGAPYDIAKFDLTLSLAESHGQIGGVLEYATALFDRATIERYVGYLRSLLVGMVADDERSIERIALLSEAERHRVLVEWNDTATPYPVDRCIHELFEDQAEKVPDAIAVVHEGAQLTYGELNARANRIAHHLRTLGVKPDTRVALCVERSLEMIVGLLAVLKAGGAYVPMDPSYPIERLSYLLVDSVPAVVLTHTDVPAAVQGLLYASGVAIVDLVADAQQWETALESNPDRLGLTPEHVAYVIYTSGSTGQPKGVMVRHRNLVSSTVARIETYGGYERFLLLSSIAFDSSVAGIWGTLLSGGALCVAKESRVTDPILLRSTIRERRITSILAVPSLLQILLDEPSAPEERSLRQIVVAGEVCPPELIERVAALEPQATMYNEYGPTENTVWATVYRCSVGARRLAVSIGRPVANTLVYIVDTNGEPVPIGVAGELYIGGAGVALGYLDRPELTAERFIDSPFVDGDRLYKTGDLARYLPDGNIEFLGRNDFQVKLRGFRIELGEIEARLAQYAGIRDVVVLAREDAPGEKRLVAYYTVSGKTPELSVDTLRAHLMATLPEYMVPSAYVVLDALPLTPNGKCDRNALPAPDGTAYATRAYEEPLGETACAVAQIWSELLKLDRVGRHDNFFELGGHSLLAVRVISRLRLVFGVEISLGELFAHPVLGDFAAAMKKATKSTLPAITMVNRDEPLLLSFAQQRLWFLSQMEGVGQAYHMPLGLRLHGKLDRNALRLALDRIVARHEALRTTFSIVDGEPVQRIAAPGIGFLLLEHDLRERVGAVDELERIATEEAIAPFDLCAGPLVRGRLVSMGEDEHALLITMHHIVSDGWSMGVLIGELSALYRTYREGGADPLPALTVQYADYAAWQRRWLTGEALQEQVGYWQRTLEGAPAVLEVPTDRARPIQQDHAGARIGLQLDAELAAGLKALSQRHGMTLFMTLVGAWGALLGRLAGQEDVVIGTPVANRTSTEVEELIGFFVNTLALRLDFSGNPTVSEMLDRVKAQTLQAQQHQELPFEQVVEIANPPRSLAHPPLFQAMFVWQNNEAGDLTLPGLTVEPMGTDYAIAKFDLTLSLGEYDGRIVGALEYATSLFDRATVERYIGYFRSLLGGMVANEEQRIAHVPILSEAERHQVLVEWNDTAAPFPAHACIHELFEEQVAKTPDAIAVAYADAKLTYAELNEQANRLAHHLHSLGVRPDVRVALCVERGLEMIVGLLAVLKAGGAYVPMDPSYPVERLGYMLDDSAPMVVLTHANASANARELLSASDVAIVDLVADAQQWESASASNPEHPDLTPEHLAYVIYTSGSTGQPKGVMVQHAGVCNLGIAQIEAFSIDRDCRVLQFASSSFDACVSEVVISLCSGASLYMPPAGVMLAGEALAQIVERHCITHVTLPPAVLNALPVELDLAPIRILVVAGEALSEALVRRWAPGRRLINAYGPTESSVCATLYECDPNLESAPPIGRPIANVRVYILDASTEPVPVGVTGELFVGGAGVARGYLNRSELTAERFVPSPFVDGDRLYKTGDLARYLPDGNIEFLGRNDFQVKIRGFRIELGEIEARLSEHSGISEVVVLAREDVPGERRLVAYHTLAADAGEVGIDALRAHLLAVLPEYMVPAAYIALDALPLTPNGKLDRKALPAPDEAAYAVRVYEEPLGETELAIAQIWSELLVLERAGRHDNFFELGGHSLLAVRVISRLRQIFGIEVSLSELFAHPVLGDLAAAMTKAAKSTLPAITMVTRDEPLSLSFAQQRLWFLSQLDEVSQAYHIPLGLRLHGELDRGALRLALDRIVARHEALRTTFSIVDDEPVQRIDSPDVGFLLLDHDLSERADAGDELERIVAEEAIVPFDLATGPLIRGRLIAIDENEHALLITMHHIVSDGWSIGVLIGELSALYHVYREGGSDPLPALAVQYADYAAWQRRWLTGAALQEQVGYWQRTLEGAPALLEVPTDRPRPAKQDYVGERIGLQLETELSAGLKALSQRHGTTLFMTLISAWGALLGRLAGQEDVVVGTPVANRSSTEVEELIGFFVNTLALRLDFAGDPTVSEMLNRAKTQTVQAQQHQELPFEQVVEIANPPRSLAHQPLFQAMFVWQNNEIGDLTLPGLVAEPMGTDYAIAKFDLTLNLAEADGQIAGSLEYASRLFDRATVERYTEYFRTLLAGMVANEQQSIAQIALLSGTERHQVLVEWNDTAKPYPSDRCAHELFEEQVAEFPDAIAVLYEDAQLTYAELNAQANRLAHHLRSLGVRPDARVALCVERSPEMVVGLLAVLKAGGAYVPIDPSYPVERLNYMLDDSAPVVALTHTNTSMDVQELLRASGIPIVDIIADAQQWEAESESNPARSELAPEHLAYVIYTSGSTGQPKGVMVEHRHLAIKALAARSELNFSAGDVLPNLASHAFDISLLELLLPLISGGKTLLLKRQHVMNMAELVKRTSTATFFHAVPSLMEAWLSFLGTEAARAYPALACLLVGGEAVSDDLLRKLMAHFPQARVVELYGPTEASIVSTFYRADGRKLHSVRHCIGRKFDCTRTYVLDRHLNPQVIGVAGELYIGGASIARGYLNRPELTAERFIASPFVDGDRLYKTGDLARYLPDGNIEFLGRNDFQVKIRGFRIELGEIEAQLAQYKGVRDVVVLAREDAPGEKRLVAYYTISAEAGEVGADVLRTHLLGTLPEYMVPSAYVVLDALPLTPNGKVDREALPEPDGTSYAVRAYEEPSGETESAIALMWCELLKHKQVGRKDDFFELGGHSLLAVRVISRLRKTLGVEVSLSELFAHPVLGDFAAAITKATKSTLPAITMVSRDESLPLSYAQQRLWFLSQMEGVSQAYHMPLGLRLHGALDRSALRLALDRIVARHEALRTTFAVVDDEPVQRIAASGVGFLLTEHDLRERADADDQLERIAAEEAIAPFDLVTGPLVRGRLIATGDDEHALLITMHHIVSDGWSMGVLIGELSTLYRTYREGGADPLPALTVQYADYAAWQRRWLTGEALQEQVGYWQRTLEGAPALLEVPTDRVRPVQQDHAGARIGLQLDAELATGLKALSQRHGATLFMTLLGAWGALLGRLAGQEDVVVGTPVANRTSTEVEELIGFFVNTLALRLDFSGNPTVGEMLERVKAQTLQAQHHQELPFEQVVEIANPPRSLAHPPLFQVMFVWQNNEAGDLTLPGLTVEPMGTDYAIAKFDLTLSLGEYDGRIVGALEYATSLFDRATVERYIGYFRSLLGGMVANEEQRIAHVPILSEAERHQVLVEWNDTAAPFPAHACIHELFEEQVAKTPDAIAVAYADAKLTYAELNEQANRLAHHLHSLGVRPDVRVALCVERGLEMIVGLLAVLKAGGAYVPMDPSYPVERLGYMLDDSAPMVVLTHANASANARELLSASDVAIVDLVADAQQWESASASNPEHPDLTPEHLAYVIYTSGSTGQPKGVMVQHAGVCNLGIAQIEAFSIDRDCRVLQFASSSFDACVSEVVISLCSGASLYMPPAGVMLAGEALAQIVERHCITHVTLPPAVLNALPVELDLAPIRILVVAGEALSEALVRRWAPGRRLINAYGPTESSVCATLYECDPNLESAPPIGRPIANVRVYILDASTEPVPVGVTGELFVGGAGVARGYLNRSELTAERFVPSPFVDGDRLYKTGDLARYLPDGNIEFLGRNDFQVKIRGFRIELGEIEARLSEHSGISEVVVLAREDVPGEKRLVAYYTLAAGVDEIGVDVLRKHLLATLPEYMVPAAYIALDALPLTPNGKLDRKALPEPDGNSFAIRLYEAPIGDVECAIARLWSELLKVKRVGRSDNFFELGGHSLLVVKLLTLMGHEGIKVQNVTAVFKAPTVRGLAELASRNDSASSLDVVTIRTEGTQPPLFLIHEVTGLDTYFPILAAHIDPDIPIYGLPSVPLHEPQYQTLEGLAARLVRIIRGARAQGPYRLAGWSLGGALAYEVATQLIGQDQEVDFLALLDTVSPMLSRTNGEMRSGHTPQSVLIQFVKNKQKPNSPREETIRDMELRAGEMEFEELIRRLREFSLIPDDLAHYANSELRQYCARFSAHANALETYVPRPISIPVHLFAARESTPGMSPPPDGMLGWGSTLSESQTIRIPVPGTHQSMIDSHAGALGAAMSREILRCGERHSDAATSQHDPLVAIQNGSPGKAPVFCIPGAGDNAIAFVPFAEALGNMWPVFGLQPQGLDYSCPPHSSVEAAASAYVRAIGKAQPNGPIHLVGHSFGGWVAFEMAQQLHASGRRMLSLTIIDSEPPDAADGLVREYTAIEAHLKWIEVVELGAERSLGIGKDELCALTDGEQVELLHRGMIDAGLMPQRSLATTLRGPMRTFGSAIRTHYRPSHFYAAPVNVVFANNVKIDSESGRRRRGDALARWNDLALLVVPWHVQGNHLTILKPPYVQLLADLWKKSEAALHDLQPL